MERNHLSDSGTTAARRRQAAALAGLLASATLISVACTGNRHPISPVPAPSSGGPVARGQASWYGPKFDGHRTASGERYDMHGLTAAHPSLPFGTLVQVTNLENGRQVVVRINDRGPFGRRRVIDLSYAAARELAMVGPGTARVELALVAAVDAAAGPPAAAPTSATLVPSAATAATASPEDEEIAAHGTRTEPLRAAALHYTVQVGAFGEVERAESLQQDLAHRYPEAAVRSDGIWHRVQVGLFGDREQAETLRQELSSLGLAAVVVAAR
jgi:rare lipoprotein A